MNSLDQMSVIDGKWYVIVKGDYAGRVYGNIYDVSNLTKPSVIPTTPTWKACKLAVTRVPTASNVAVRRLLQAYTQANRVGSEEQGRRIMMEAVDEIQAMPDLKHVDFSHVRRLQETLTS